MVVPIVGSAVFRRPIALLGRPSHDLDKLPGPPAQPLLGNLLDIGNPRAHQVIVGWAKKHGPIYRFKLLTTDHVVITDPTEIGPLLGKAEGLPRPTLFYFPFNMLGGPERLPSLVTTKNPALSAEVRRVCAPAFNAEATRSYFPTVRQAVGNVCDVLAAQRAQQEAAGAVDEKGVDMCDAALRVSLDVVGITMFRRDFNASTYGECPMLETLPSLLEELSWRALNPLRLLQHTVMPWTKDAREFTERLQATHELWAELAREIRAIDIEAADAAGDSSLMACMAKIRDPDTGKLLTEAELAPHIATILLAAYETSAHSVAWALYDLARHPEAQAKLAAELEGAGLLWVPGKSGRDLEYSDLSSLPYLDQVWRESLRLHPGGSVVPIRIADRDVTLKNGLRLPQGTYVWMSIVALHNSPFNFVDPERFWPERWAQQGAAAGAQAGAAGALASEGDGAAAAAAAGCPAHTAAGKAGQEEQEAKAGGGSGRCPFTGGWGPATPVGNAADVRGSFMPFSRGPHDCLGQGLANAEGKAMLAMLCARFAFDLAPSMQSAEDVRAAEVIRLTLQPGDGVWLKLRPRGDAKGGTAKAGEAGAEKAVLAAA